MRKSKIFIALSLSFMAGVLLGSIWNIQTLWLSLAAAFGIAVFAVGRNFVRIAGLCLLFAIVGTFRIQTDLATPNEFTEWLDTKQEFFGTIVEDVDVRTDRQLLTVQPDGHDQRVLITMLKSGNFFYGDRVLVKGKVVEAKAFDDFDYPGFLERHRIYALMRYPTQVAPMERNAANSGKYYLLKTKAWVAGHVAKLLPEPQASLLLGIVIGAKKTLPQEITDQFAATGVSHIVAVSGFNISIIVGALAYLARYLGRRTSFWVSLVFIFSFVVIAGLSASVVRAAVMGLLLLVSYNIGRLYAIGPSICLAAGVMLLVNPRILYWDVGFQLSFAATIGIVYAVPVLETLTEKIPEWFGAKTVLLVTVAATLATLPLVLFNFGRLSVVAILANLLIVPVIPLVMILGASMLVPFFGVGLAFVCGLLLSYILAVTGSMASWPFASLEVVISLQLFCAMLVALVALYLLLYHLARKKNPAFMYMRI